MAAIRFSELGAIGNLAFLNGGLTSFALDQTTDQIETVFQVQEAMTIRRLYLRYGLRTGTPPTYIISLQGVDGSGNPDGTVKGGGSPASVTFTPPADTSWDGTGQWLTLANAYAPTAGETLAWVLAYSSGTVNGSNFSSFTHATGVYGAHQGYPYTKQNNAGVRTAQSAMPIFGYGDTASAYGTILSNLAASTAFTSATTPDELALRFKLPQQAGNTFRLRGARVALSTLVAGNTGKLILYSGTTAQASVTYDTDHARATSNDVMDIYFTDSTLPDLSYGQAYYLAVQPQGATNHAVLQWTVATAADMECLPYGTEWYRAERTDAGAWTETTTIRPIITPLVVDISGGGSHFIG